MILADTSLWVDHLRRGSKRLGDWLVEGIVLTHPFVIGEIACGHLTRRREILALLENLPQVPPAAQDEVLDLLERCKLAGKGLGWVDAHLLTSALLANCALVTNDRALGAAATRLGLTIE